MRYQDRVVIITGGGRGIGAGCARAFVEAGAVVLIGDRNQQTGSALGTALSLAGAGRAHFIACDVTRCEDIENLITETIKLTGRIDCLINNAGWHPPHKPIDDFSAEEFRDLLELNLVSTFTAANSPCRLADGENQGPLTGRRSLRLPKTGSVNNYFIEQNMEMKKEGVGFLSH